METIYRRLFYVFLVLFILSTGYNIYTNYQDFRELAVQESFNQGSSYGYEVAIVDVLQRAITCPPQGVPLQYQNQTFILVLVDCLGGGA